MKEVLDDIERWRAGGHRVAVARVVGARGLGAARSRRHDGRERRRRGRRLGLGRLRRGRGRRRALEVLAGERERGVITSATPTTRRSRSASRAAAPSTSSSSRSTGDATVTTTAPSRRPGVRGVARRAARRGAGRAGDGHRGRDRERRARSCSCGPAATPLGTLGDPDLDRVVAPRRARRARGRAHVHPPLRRARRGARGHGVGVHRVVRAAAADDHLRRGRLHRRARAASPRCSGYRVTVCDARAVFATRQRFPMADEVVNDWPDRYLDEGRRRPRPARRGVRAHPRRQVRRARDRRRAGDRGRLPRRDGIAHARTTSGSSGCARRASTDDELARVHAPIGLDIGARTPEETAVSICAEIIAERTGRRRRVAARDGTGPIHRVRDTYERSRGADGSRDRGQARRGGRRVARARARPPPRRSPRRACTVAICSRDPGADRGRRGGDPRRDPARRRRRRRRTARSASCARRADALGGIDILVANGGGPPAGTFAVDRAGGVPRRVRAELPVGHRDVPRGGARDAASSGGGGCSRSRRSRCASRSPG